MRTLADPAVARLLPPHALDHARCGAAKPLLLAGAAAEFGGAVVWVEPGTVVLSPVVFEAGASGAAALAAANGGLLADGEARGHAPAAQAMAAVAVKRALVALGASAEAHAPPPPCDGGFSFWYAEATAQKDSLLASWAECAREADCICPADYATTSASVPVAIGGEDGGGGRRHGRLLRGGTKPLPTAAAATATSSAAAAEGAVAVPLPAFSAPLVAEAALRARMLQRGVSQCGVEPPSRERWAAPLAPAPAARQASLRPYSLCFESP